MINEGKIQAQANTSVFMFIYMPFSKCSFRIYSCLYYHYLFQFSKQVALKMEYLLPLSFIHINGIEIAAGGIGQT